MMRKKPSELLYSQDSINKRFKNGKTIQETFEDFLSGSVDPDDLRPIAAKFINGKWIVCEGNRRLYVYKKLAQIGFIDRVPVVPYRGEPTITAVRGVPIQIRSRQNISRQLDDIVSRFKIRIRPMKIHYSNDYIGSEFDDGQPLLEIFRVLHWYCQKSVNRTITVLGRRQLKSFCNIKIGKLQGRWVAIEGNRRLFLLQQLECAGLLESIVCYNLKSYRSNYLAMYNVQSLRFEDTNLLDNIDQIVSPPVEKLYPLNIRFSRKTLSTQWLEKDIFDIFEQLVTANLTAGIPPTIHVRKYADKWTAVKNNSLLFLYQNLEKEGLISTIPVTRDTGISTIRSSYQDAQFQDISPALVARKMGDIISKHWKELKPSDIKFSQNKTQIAYQQRSRQSELLPTFMLPSFCHHAGLCCRCVLSALYGRF